MSTSKNNSAKKIAAKKSIRNVLVQPYDLPWPLIADDNVDEYTRLIEQVDGKSIIYGCNPVTRLLQTGTTPAFFILNSFHPKIFAKTIIQMARRRNPAVLVLAVPSFPAKPKANSMMMAIATPKEGEPVPETLTALLDWMKKVCAREPFVDTKALARLKSLRAIREQSSKRKSNADKVVDQPLTKEQLAAIYILEPAKKTVDETTMIESNTNPFDETMDFISFSGSADNAKRKPTNAPKLNERKQRYDPYIPLTVNRIKGNPERVEHKKFKRR
ncbi:uncharacterized protein LOC126573112 [Anopheles aquasalis]|uniref:uncharacterized protein LOC126573112 n=1 Tax=Anopheles aquasalis TaxID=42839 RepID=UPI00215A8A2C|nr:uncharacterized protein LOC126573112 [Anopheles aquasalis]